MAAIEAARALQVRIRNRAEPSSGTGQARANLITVLANGKNKDKPRVSAAITVT